GHLVELLDEDRAALLEIVDHVAVVHDLVAHVDRRAEGLDGALDDLDGAIDAGAEAAGVGEDDIHGGHSTPAILSGSGRPWEELSLWERLQPRSGCRNRGYSRSHRPSRPYGFFPGARMPNRAMPMAPPTIAMSATLNAGQ